MYNAVRQIAKKPSRNPFSGASVRYIGGIEDNNLGTPLTGSCKVLKFQDTQGKIITIVIDFGLYQGGKKLGDLNNSIDPEVLNADYIVITHAHLDHVGRLPMLTKEGFKGKIIMTPQTKALSELSLVDSAKVMLNEYDMIVEKNRRDGNRYREIKKYLTNLEKLNEPKINKAKRAQLEGVNKTIKDSFSEEKFGELIQNIKDVNGDISELLSDVIEPLFTLDDVKFLFSGKKEEDIPGETYERHSISTVSREQTIKLDILSSHTGAKDLKDIPQIESIFLELFDAGHILGSAQVLFTAKVRTILSGSEAIRNGFQEIIDEFKYLFSGDLGREDDGNNAGTLKMPSEEHEFIEIEGTYADRNHPDRKESIDTLYDTLLKSGKHILLPTFSLQRTQDTLLLLLDYIEKVTEPKREELKKENKEYKEELKEYREMLDKDGILSDAVDAINTEMDSINAKISENEGEIDRLDITIISDSPLSHRVNNVYQVFDSNTYSPLTKEAQEKRFGKSRIKFLGPKESQDLFKSYGTDAKLERKKKKDRRTKIIVSSGGMCEGGPVIEHIKRMVSIKDATIIFTGYAPPESLGGQLRTESQVIIDGQIKNVRARIKDITGFSGHAGKDTLIRFLNSAAARVTTIVHGGNDRHKLARDSGLKNKKGIKIPVPGTVIKMAFRKPKKK